MKYIAAYLLLQTGGKAEPTAADITKLLSTVGIDADSERLGKLISELKGKTINDLIAEGSSKLSSVRIYSFLLRCWFGGLFRPLGLVVLGFSSSNRSMRSYYLGGICICVARIFSPPDDMVSFHLKISRSIADPNP